MRIAIIGNSGSGKSTLARNIATCHALVSLDLDTLAWEAGKIAVARDEADAIADVRNFCATHDRWVIEGCYANLVRATFAFSPQLIFIDPGVDACIANCRARPWEPHKYKSKQEQDEKLEFLIEWVRAYYTRDGDLSLAAHQALFDEYHGAKHKLVARVGQDFVDMLC
jgi:adenylate kinase family enzyme